jgi:hypothetical protein
MLAKLRKEGQKKHNKTVRNTVNGIGIAPFIPKKHYMKKLISLSCCAIVLFIIGCKKEGDDENGGGDSEKMQLITSAAWKYDTAVAIVFGSQQKIPDGLLLDCDKDNLITLKNDGTGTVAEGATKCEAGDPDTTPLTWEFKSNETVINIPDTLYGRISGDAQIQELSATKLKLKKTVPVTEPVPMNIDVIIDLKH